MRSEAVLILELVVYRESRVCGKRQICADCEVFKDLLPGRCTPKNQCTCLLLLFSEFFA